MATTVVTRHPLLQEASNPILFVRQLHQETPTPPSRSAESPEESDVNNEEQQKLEQEQQEELLAHNICHDFLATYTQMLGNCNTTPGVAMPAVPNDVVIGATMRKCVAHVALPLKDFAKLFTGATCTWHHDVYIDTQNMALMRRGLWLRVRHTFVPNDTNSEENQSADQSDGDDPVFVNSASVKYVTVTNGALEIKELTLNYNKVMEWVNQQLLPLKELPITFNRAGPFEKPDENGENVVRYWLDLMETQYLPTPEEQLTY